MVSLALIGTGRWGKNFLETTRSLPGVEIKYVCAKTQATLSLIPDKYVKTTNYHELFKFPGIDGVIIATPASTHFEIAKSFLERDYNLFIEKPVTAILNEALALKKLHHKHKKSIILVGHIQVYNPAYTKLKESVKFIGNIKNLVYQGLQSPPRTDVSVFEDWGPHPISIFLDLTEKTPNTVFARFTSRDTIHLELEFPKNIVAKADIGWTAPQRVRKFSVIGTRGSIVIDASKTPQRLYSADRYGHRTKSLGFTEKLSPLAMELMEFAACIKTGRHPRTDLAQAVEVMKIIELARKSANAGGKLLKFKRD